MFHLTERFHQPIKNAFHVANIKDPQAGERIPIKSQYSRYVTIPATDTIVNEKGEQVKIRFIKGCPLIVVEEQTQKKFTPNPTVDIIEVIDNTLVIDIAKEKTKYEYLIASGYAAKDGEDASSAIVREAHPDQDDREEMERKYQFARALRRIEDMTEEEARNLLSLRGVVRVQNMEEMTMKRRLSSIAESDPEFIMKGIEKLGDRRIVIARKAVDKGFITLAAPGVVAWQKDGKIQSEIVRCGDLGGTEGKFKRFVDFLKTEDGKIVFDRMVELVGDVPYGQDLTGEKSGIVSSADPDDEDDEDEAGLDEWSDDEGDVQPEKKRGRPRKTK